MSTVGEGNLLRSEAELKLDLVFDHQALQPIACRSVLTPAQARKQKAEKHKDVGDPISLPGAPIDVKIRGDYAWVAESTHITRKVDLQVRLFVVLYQSYRVD